MRIAILSLKSCCDYFHIGGAESIMRRLAWGLQDLGHRIDYILYGANCSKTYIINEEISLNYCVKFDDALELLGQGYDHVLTIQIAPLDRLRFALFQRKPQRKTRFHRFMLGTPSSLARWLFFLWEALLCTKGGRAITISANTARVLSKWRIPHTVLLPPVPTAYYSELPSGDGHGLNLTYMGRLDPEKGSHKALDLFKQLQGLEGITTRVFGYSCCPDRSRLIIETHINDLVSTDEKMADNLYKPELDENVIRLLRETDVLVLPYKSMSGTIDPPLLLLEAMAAGCVCLVCHTGNVESTYGSSDFVLNYDDFVKEGLSLIQRMQREPDIIARERSRVADKRKSLAFDAPSICRQLAAILNPQGQL